MNRVLSKAACRGFSLVELLMVIAVVSIAFGIAMAIPLGEEREGLVRGSAEELAAVLRETRVRAITHNRSYAVVFNITNAPGSSGKILNNRSGGHWYRVLGPKDVLLGGNGDAMSDENANMLPLIDMQRSPLTGLHLHFGAPPLRHYLELVSRSWIDEPHRLPKGKVRFLALTDQDNGDNLQPSRGGFYGPTYPRPWFGWWDASTKQLHTWGGYDPQLKPTIGKTQVNGRICSMSGFFYEGWEGEITGCINPTDRRVLDDDEFSTAPGAEPGAFDALDRANKRLYTVLKQGESRPLINADWVDYAIIFRPDGKAETSWFRLRQGYWLMTNFHPGSGDPYVTTFPRHDTSDAGVADMCGGTALSRNWSDYTTSHLHLSQFQREATDYVNRTGYHWITLAMDAKNDDATFASAEDALRSLNPIYRVGVSPDGQVRVIRVQNSHDGSLAFDASITGSDWQDKNKIWGKPGSTWSYSAPVTEVNYVNHQLNNANGTPRGLPIFDMVVPEMLRERKWWWRFP